MFNESGPGEPSVSCAWTSPGPFMHRYDNYNFFVEGLPGPSCAQACMVRHDMWQSAENLD